MKKIKIKYSNIILFSLITLLIILFIITSIMLYKLYKDTLGKNSSINNVEILDSMDEHGYNLTENHTKYFKKLYYELKDLFDKNDYEEDEYAKLIAKMFVADFYDLNSKLNKSDVGGVQFIYSSYREDFKNYASDSTGIYYYIKNNIYGDRNQKLPIVKEVEIVSIENTIFTFSNIVDNNAYKIDLTVVYEENMGYPTTVQVILLHVGEKLEIVEMN